ncbi:hypothetical protein NEMBOFW57_006231 [Staphylotrichum longicolle]|uniref:Uncharacterized protein n=1 Tax=Staphylotrichum longicolle TaxID=669026 RepID=A0AAD4EZ10_9PEZI|nr:hypothetical protein NEMBOFW57_006231 [Staphylotrichum longicolle]
MEMQSSSGADWPFTYKYARGHSGCGNKYRRDADYRHGHVVPGFGIVQLVAPHHLDLPHLVLSMDPYHAVVGHFSANLCVYLSADLVSGHFLVGVYLSANLVSGHVPPGVYLGTSLVFGRPPLGVYLSANVIILEFILPCYYYHNALVFFP